MYLNVYFIIINEFHVSTRDFWIAAAVAPMSENSEGERRIMNPASPLF